MITINILQLYQIGINELIKYEIETPKIDARAILEHILCVDFGKLSLHYYDDAESVKDEYLSKIKLRCENMPLSYITNKKEFFSHSFFVRQGVLIPRAETENLVQAVLDFVNAECRMQNAELCGSGGSKFVDNLECRMQNAELCGSGNGKLIYNLESSNEELCCGTHKTSNEENNSAFSILHSALNHPFAVADLCSGSGCIGISIALSLPLAVLDLYEFSDDAIEISKINKENLGATNVNIIKRDLLTFGLDKKYDVIVANPPYIPKVEIPTLMNEVKDYEPEMALTDGEDGNLFYRRIAELSLTHLNKGGILAVEVGINQHNIVKDIFIEILGNAKNIKIINDYFGIERVVLYEAN